ncbi:MAG: hypothetical protein ACYDAD_16040, partial [Acidimicrobiales bacterium]
ADPATEHALTFHLPGHPDVTAAALHGPMLSYTVHFPAAAPDPPVVMHTPVHAPVHAPGVHHPIRAAHAVYHDAGVPDGYRSDPYGGR